MPFDDKTFQSAPEALAIPEFVPGPEGLRRLSWVLRHPEVWPTPDFEWDFQHILANRTEDVRVGLFRHRVETRICGTKGCALGVAMLVWPQKCKLSPIHDTDLRGIDAAQRWFGMSHAAAATIFTYGTYEDREPTPADVASAIDAYLAKSA